MANIGQHILIRTDLGFSTGLLAAQVAHIHAQCMREAILYSTGDLAHMVAGEETWKEWLKDPYIYVRACPNRELLEYFYGKASFAQIPQTSWTDTVYMTVSGVKMPFSDILTGAAIGPVDSDKAKAIGLLDLPLL